MNIETLEDETHETRFYQRRIEFAGASSEPFVGYVNKGKAWLPDVATARWSHGESIEDITLHGPLLKKDGTPSQNRVNKRYVTPSHRDWEGRFNDPAPAWLLELFEIEIPNNETSN